MKQYLSYSFGTFFMLTFGAALNAQITVTQADMPEKGHVYVMNVDTSGSFSPLNASPSAETWNFSTLTSTQTNSYQFMNPAITPFVSAFPNSDLADSLIYGNGCTYYSSTASSYSEM